MATNEITSLDEYAAKVREVGWEVASAIDTFCVMSALAVRNEEMIAKLERQEPLPAHPFPWTMSVLLNSMPIHFFVNACRIMERTNTRLSLWYIFQNSGNLQFPYYRADSEIENLFAEIAPVFENLKKVRGKCIAHLHGLTNYISEVKVQGLSENDVSGYLRRCEKVYGLLLGAVEQRPSSSRFDGEQQCKKEADRFFSANMPV